MNVKTATKNSERGYHKMRVILDPEDLEHILDLLSKDNDIDLNTVDHIEISENEVSVHTKEQVVPEEEKTD